MACYDLLLEAQEAMSRTPRRKKITIDLAPDIEAWVKERADSLGMTPSRWLRIRLDVLYMESKGAEWAGRGGRRVVSS